MAVEFRRFTVSLPIDVAERASHLAKAREFPSVSAFILRAVEFYTAEYSLLAKPKTSKKILDLQKELNRLLKTYSESD